MHISATIRRSGIMFALVIGTGADPKSEAQSYPVLRPEIAQGTLHEELDAAATIVEMMGCDFGEQPSSSSTDTFSVDASLLPDETPAGVLSQIVDYIKSAHSSVVTRIYVQIPEAALQGFRTALEEMQADPDSGLKLD